MTDFTSFKAAFKGDIVTASDENYASSIARWTVTAERNAKLVAFAKDASDVSLAITFARANNLPIAVRGGGHSLAGASSVENGLAIDLSRYFSTVKVDKEQRRAYIGGGTIWEKIDKETIKYGLALVAGTVNTTGVGGVATGGGYGWQTSSHGLAVDNLIQATVVLASGEIVTASETSHPDLFWGIRGGGSNFGVVTEFVFRLHEQRPTVFFGMLVYREDQGKELLEVTKKWWEKGGGRQGMMQISLLMPDGNPAILAFPFYNGTEAEGRKNYKEFLDIGPVQNTTTEMPYEVVNSVLNFAAAPGQGVYCKPVTRTSPDPEAFTAAYQRCLEISRSSEYHGIQAKMLFDYHPTDKIDTIPRSATAFNRGKPRTHNIVLHFGWLGEDDKELHNGKKKVDIARELAKEVGDLITGGKMDSSIGYTNYDGDANYTGDGTEATEARIKDAFGENYPRLQEVKRQYDPELVFNRWFPITPA